VLAERTRHCTTIFLSIVSVALALQSQRTLPMKRLLTTPNQHWKKISDWESP